MTEEEYKKKAEEWVVNNSDESIHSFNGEKLIEAYMGGVKESENLKVLLNEKDKIIYETKKLLKELKDAYDADGYFIAWFENIWEKAEEFVEEEE